MKKIFISVALAILAISPLKSSAEAYLNFPSAVATCEKYSQEGAIEYGNEYFNLLITLEKKKGDTCIYKEKIYQGRNYQLLTCKFSPTELSYISNSMQRFNDTFKTQIAKNRIFEAKLTTNGEVFQKYLANPNYCKITHSKK